jgi:hypothetical protein
MMYRVRWRGVRLALCCMLLGTVFAAAHTVEAQQTNIQFTASWQTPQGVNQLNDYFAAPVSNSVGVTMLYLWAPN